MNGSRPSAPTAGLAVGAGTYRETPATSPTFFTTLRPAAYRIHNVLGRSIEPIHNPIDVVELALEKGAAAVLMPVSCRRALIDLSDDVATKVQVLFYADAADALRKAVHE